MGTTAAGDEKQDPDELSYAALGPDVYEGTAGIALFLAEVSSRTGDKRCRATAEAAIEYALATRRQLPYRFRFALYSGELGVAFSAACVGVLLARDDFVAEARLSLSRLVTDDGTDATLDVISGVASAATPLLRLSETLNDEALAFLAIRLGRRVVSSAFVSPDGWSWGEDATGFATPRNLTGLGHGAAGIGWALLELYHYSGEQPFRHAAIEAFRYEESVFDATADNWPDYRFTDGRDAQASFGLAWCFGAPGIGLSRLRAYEILGSSQYFADVDAVIRAITKALQSRPDPGTQDFSLCHGWAGIAEFLMCAERQSGNVAAGRLLRAIAEDGASRHEGEPESWHCGLPHGSSPSLMLGLSGIGYFFLRLADRNVPSLLLIEPGSTRQTNRLATLAR